MYKVILRKDRRIKRKLKIRSKILGTSKKPRLSVFRSLRYTYAQLIDDSKGKTIVDISNSIKKYHDGKNKSQAAYELGKLIAEKALKKGIIEAEFDRNGYRYHGRIKRLAEGAKEGGLKV